MKMSDEFTLPTEMNRDGEIIADDKYKAQFDGRGMTAPNTADLTHEQARYITHAVNNHDALVELLTGAINRGFSPSEWADNANKATELLDKINGESK